MMSKLTHFKPLSSNDVTKIKDTFYAEWLVVSLVHYTDILVHEYSRGFHCIYLALQRTSFIRTLVREEDNSCVFSLWLDGCISVASNGLNHWSRSMAAAFWEVSTDFLKFYLNVDLKTMMGKILLVQFNSIDFNLSDSTELIWFFPYHLPFLPQKLRLNPCLLIFGTVSALVPWYNFLSFWWPFWFRLSSSSLRARCCWYNDLFWILSTWYIHRHNKLLGWDG